MEQALFFHQGDNQLVFCHLCAHGCRIAEGKTGVCGVRKNVGGELFSTNYGRLVSGHIDPVEKKPFYHICPGSRSYSIATVGCTFQCLNCQNYQISQYSGEHRGETPGRPTLPAEVVDAALRGGCASIAYTYTEPTVFYEFSDDTARLAREKGLYNLFVSNGYLTNEAAVHIAGVLDGANIDLKSFSDGFYRKVCKARLAPVLNTIRLLKKQGVWIEITTLVIPGMNDSDEELKEIANFIKATGADIPWHVSAFYPTYKMRDVPPTPPATLIRAREIGLACGLRYVYTGNIAVDDGEDTFCHQCGQAVVKRSRFTVVQNRLQDGRCTGCGAVMDGIWTCRKPDQR